MANPNSPFGSFYLRSEIPYFDGKYVEWWIYHAECFFYHHQTIPEQKLGIGKVYLLGEALQWYRHWDWNARMTWQTVSWETFALDLKIRFSTPKTLKPQTEISIFSGNDVDVWINRINAYFDYYQITTERKLASVDRYMTGEASDWFCQWFRDMYWGGRKVTWEVFLTDLRIRFKPPETLKSNSHYNALQVDHSADFAALGSAMEEIQKPKSQLEIAAQTVPTEANTSAGVAVTDTNVLEEKLVESLAMVEDTKKQLKECKDSEANAHAFAMETLIQLETTRAVVETLQLEGTKSSEAYNTLAQELGESKGHIKALKELVCKLKDELINSSGEEKGPTDVELETLMKSKVDVSISAHETAEVKELVKSTLHLNGANEQVEIVKSESIHRETDLVVNLEALKSQAAELKANMMGKETEPQCIIELEYLLSTSYDKIWIQVARKNATKENNFYLPPSKPPDDLQSCVKSVEWSLNHMLQSERKWRLLLHMVRKNIEHEAAGHNHISWTTLRWNTDTEANEEITDYMYTSLFAKMIMVPITAGLIPRCYVQKTNREGNLIGLGLNESFTQVRGHMKKVVCLSPASYGEINYLRIFQEIYGLDPVNLRRSLLMKAKRCSEKYKRGLMIYEYVSFIPQLIFISNIKALLFCHKWAAKIFYDSAEQVQTMGLMLVWIMFSLESDQTDTYFQKQAAMDGNFLQSINIGTMMFSLCVKLYVGVAYIDLQHQHIWARYVDGHVHFSLVIALTKTYVRRNYWSCTIYWELMLSENKFERKNQSQWIMTSGVDPFIPPSQFLTKMKLISLRESTCLTWRTYFFKIGPQCIDSDWMDNEEYLNGFTKEASAHSIVLRTMVALHNFFSVITFLPTIIFKKYEWSFMSYDPGGLSYSDIVESDSNKKRGIGNFMKFMSSMDKERKEEVKVGVERSLSNKTMTFKNCKGADQPPYALLHYLSNDAKIIKDSLMQETWYYCFGRILHVDIAAWMIFKNLFYIFSLPRPPEFFDLEDKVSFKGEGMIRIIII